MPRIRRAGAVAVLAAAPLALAYRFAVIYRRRAGFPERRPPKQTPADLDLSYETLAVPIPGGSLAAWFVPARDGAPGPGVALVHGWESARDRLLPHIRFLHAAGFHCLLIDVRGHGANPAESLPISGGEFGADATAALDALLERPDVTRGAIFGHSMGGVGAILAGAADPRCAAIVSVSAAADPRLLARQTFRLARLPIPGPIAHPLAWLTARVYVRPRGHSLRAVSAERAIATYDGPILLVHGAQDSVMPVSDARRLARAAIRGRKRRRRDTTNIESMIVAEGHHSWLYEFPEFRARVASFLAAALGGPLTPSEAATVARATDCVRPDEPEVTFAAIRRPGDAPMPSAGLSARPDSSDRDTHPKPVEA